MRSLKLEDLNLVKLDSEDSILKYVQADFMVEPSYRTNTRANMQLSTKGTRKEHRWKLNWTWTSDDISLKFVHLQCKNQCTKK